MKHFALLLFLILVILPSLVSATDYYVRPTSGEYGAENGLSWETAFDGFGDIEWPSIGAGDTLYIAGGTYSESLTIGASGSPGNPVTVRVGQTSPYHGMVILDG